MSPIALSFNSSYLFTLASSSASAFLSPPPEASAAAWLATRTSSLSLSFAYRNSISFNNLIKYLPSATLQPLLWVQYSLTQAEPSQPSTLWLPPPSCRDSLSAGIFASADPLISRLRSNPKRSFMLIALWTGSLAFIQASSLCSSILASGFQLLSTFPGDRRTSSSLFLSLIGDHWLYHWYQCLFIFEIDADSRVFRSFVALHWAKAGQPPSSGSSQRNSGRLCYRDHPGSSRQHSSISPFCVSLAISHPPITNALSPFGFHHSFSSG